MEMNNSEEEVMRKIGRAFSSVLAGVVGIAFLAWGIFFGFDDT